MIIITANGAMSSTDSLDELNAFAKRLRIPKKDLIADGKFIHYDIDDVQHDTAKKKGAMPVSSQVFSEVALRKEEVSEK